MSLITDLNPKEASPISVLDDIAPRPILFNHSKGDGSVPYTESEGRVEKYPEYFTLWLTDGEGHVKSFEQNIEEYIKGVDEFFSKLIH